MRALARLRVGLLLLAGTACLGESDVPLDAFPGRTGSLDLSRPLAIGDGYLAGAQDGALFPHLYGVLPMTAVRWVKPLPLGANGHELPELEP